MAERILLAPKPPGPIVWLDYKELCEREGIKPTQMRQAIRNGRIPRGVAKSEKGLRRLFPEYWLTLRDQFLIEDAQTAARSARKRRA